MPGPTQTPVKKNPFVLTPDELKANAPRHGTQQPEVNPFILSDEDFQKQNIKKKDGTTDSGTPSAPTLSPDGAPSTSDINQAQAAFNNKQLTPEAANVLQQTDHNNDSGLVGLNPEQTKTYIDAHNAPSISDLTNKTYNILSTSIPTSTDPKINASRQQLLSAVKNGDQGAITTAKNFINTGIQKQISDIKSEATKYSTPFGGTGTQTIFEPSEAQKNQIAALEKQASDVTSTLNDYAINSAANQKEIQTQVRAEVAGVQRGSTPNIAAEDLGKTIEKVNGGLPNPNGNLQYERQKAGFEALINNKQLKYNDLYVNGTKTKNQTLLDQAQKEKAEIETLKSRANNLIDQFPDVAVTQVARAIGDEISETHPRNMIISKSDVLESAQRLEKQYPGFMAKYGKQINTVAQSEGEGLFGMFNEGLVPKGGFTGGLDKGLQDLQYGGASFVAKRLGDTQTGEFAEHMMESPVSRGTKRSGETFTKIVYDVNGQAFKEKSNEDYGKINWNSGPRFAGQSLPGLAEWVLAEEATGGLVTAALVKGTKALNTVGRGVNAVTNALIGSEEAGAGFNAISQTAKQLENIKRTTGLVGASYRTGYDANHKLAESLIDDNSSDGEAKKNVFAHLTTLMTAGAFKLVGISPGKFIEGAVTKSIAPDIINALEDNGFKQLPKNKLQDLMVNTIIPKVKTFAVEQFKSIGEGGKVAAAQLADTKVKEFISQVINPEKANATTIDENIKSFTQQTLFMGLLGLPKSIVGGITSPTFKDALYEIGTRAPIYIERINQSIANGDVSTERGNQMIAAAKTMGEEVAKAQFGTTDDGHLMTVGQKRDLAVQQFRKRAAAGYKEAGIEVEQEKVNSDAEDQIKTIKSQNTQLPLEETEAFQTAVEVDKEGNEIEKPKIINEIHPDGKYRYMKNGRETITTGTELLAHIPDSEEPIIIKGEGRAAGETTETDNPETDNTEVADKAKKLFLEQVADGTVKTPYKNLLEKDPSQVDAVIQELGHQIEVGGNESQLLKDGYSQETVNAIKEATGNTEPEFELPPVEEEKPTEVTPEKLTDLRTPEESTKLIDQELDKKAGRKLVSVGNERVRAEDEVSRLKKKHSDLEKIINGCL